MAKKTAPPKARPFTPKDVRLGLTQAEDVAHPLRWGIMGTGEICRQFVCAAREVPGATIAGVASRSAENAHEFAQTHGAEVYWTSVEFFAVVATAHQALVVDAMADAEQVT
ncbi:MAG: hypothetical protein QF806_08840, partial [Pseudomonadales bacterium]|nr:hypothetical protein [Pseudomonadales bacterium]